LKSSTPKLGQCARCKAYVFTAWVDGLVTTVDSTPLDVETYRQAVIQKRFTYDFKVDSQGKPSGLVTRGQFSSWGKGVVLVQHPCELITVNVIEVAPPKAPDPASFSSVKKAFVPDYSKAKPAPRAQPAIQFRTRHPAICCECRTFFTDEEKEEGRYVEIYISSSQGWAAHSERCPKPPVARSGVKVGRKFRLDGSE
jgi:hypothetical protein